MSREIKFRAWNKKGKCWITFGGVNYRYKNGTLDIIDSDNLIYEQYTGLKDKNGKEIYEGDVVDIRNGVVFLDSMRTKHDGGFGISEVIWGWSGFWARPLNGGQCASMAEFVTEKEDCKDVEIIGNVHENPELLEN